MDLVLAGHVHGGQIRLPLVGSIFVPSKYSRRYDSGTFHEGPTVMHVNRGLAGEVPLRYNCRPEVTPVVLRKLPGCLCLCQYLPPPGLSRWSNDWSARG